MSTQVKVVNLSILQAVIQETDPGRLVEVRDEIAFIQTPSGYVRLNKDAIHLPAELPHEEVRIPLYAPSTDDGWQSLSPTYVSRKPIEDLLPLADKEVPLAEYVRKFGSRIEENYRLLLGTLKHAGLDTQEDKADRVRVNGDRIIL